jgi:hypothetical protein
MVDRENIVKNYIQGYNQFDIEKMLADFHEQVVFENIQNGVTNMSLNGLTELRKQAEQAKTYFIERTQSIKSFNAVDNRCEIEISYRAILAMDFPNGLKKGQELNLLGKSIFEFEGDKIIRLTDIS